LIVQGDNGSPVRIENCTIQNNRTESANSGCDGGGLFIDIARVDISGTTILGNSGNFGGGVFMSHSNVTFDNCIIAKNVATLNGGAVAITKTDSSEVASFNHCTIVGNESNVSSETSGGGLYITEAFSNKMQTVKNSIVWGNIPAAFSGDVVVTYTFSQDVITGTGNITDSDDPLFTNFTNNVFTLKSSSPCIDAAKDGSNMGWLDN